MKKYEGVLLISDIDGTLIGEKWEVSTENAEAIRYFVDNGGTFTLATGRVVRTIGMLMQDIPVNAPIICYNGAAIFDLAGGEMLWGLPLPDDCADVLEEVYNCMPDSGIEVYSESDLYICRYSKDVDRSRIVSAMSARQMEFSDIPRPWMKAIFAQRVEQTAQLRQHLKKYSDRFYFAQSCNEFYEMLHKNANKGTALKRLLTMLPGIKKVVAAGDNENDLEMLLAADVGVATQNAIESVKQVADVVTVHCKEHAIKNIIENII